MRGDVLTMRSILTLTHSWRVFLDTTLKFTRSVSLLGKLTTLWYPHVYVLRLMRVISIHLERMDLNVPPTSCFHRWAYRSRDLEGFVLRMSVVNKYACSRWYRIDCKNGNIMASLGSGGFGWPKVSLVPKLCLMKQTELRYYVL